MKIQIENTYHHSVTDAYTKSVDPDKFIYDLNFDAFYANDKKALKRYNAIKKALCPHDGKDCDCAGWWRVNNIYGSNK